jgi:3-hydroxyacyl-CoA dehydrogenase/enoyl-CoA hydratase/3-hydroxybutyryl-CoA epimerase
MPMGPIELADTVGPRHLRRGRQAARRRRGAPRALMKHVDAGELGKKTGQGFYRWEDGKPAKAAAGPVPAGLAERLIEPYVAEARKALAEGVVGDADLVDAGAIFGPASRRSAAGRCTTRSKRAADAP